MEKTQALSFLDELTEKAKETLQICKQHDMIVLLLTEKGPVPLDLSPFLEQAEELHKSNEHQKAQEVKDAMSLLMRLAAAMTKAFGIFTVCEAWFAKPPKGELKIGPQGEVTDFGLLPRHRTDRMEVLSLSFEVKLSDGAKFSGMRIVPFTRIRDRILYDPQEDMFDGETVGRFFGIIE